MALGDYGGAFSFNDFLSPAMGRILALNPEAAIPAFEKAGVAPPLSTRVAGPGAPSEKPYVMPPSGTLPGSQSATSFDPTPTLPPRPPAPPAQPAPMSGGGSLLDILAPVEKGSPFNIRNLFGGGTPAAPPASPTGGATFNERFNPVLERPLTAPPTARPTAGPYAGPSGGGGGPSTEDTVPLPPERPTEQIAAEGTNQKTNAAATKLLDALAGVRAPPAPPAPVLHPYVPYGGRMPDTVPVASLLAQIMAGKVADPSTLRLLQAIGR